MRRAQGDATHMPLLSVKSHVGAATVDISGCSSNQTGGTLGFQHQRQRSLNPNGNFPRGLKNRVRIAAGSGDCSGAICQSKDSMEIATVNFLGTLCTGNWGSPEQSHSVNQSRQGRARRFRLWGTPGGRVSTSDYGARNTTLAVRRPAWPRSESS